MRKKRSDSCRGIVCCVSDFTYSAEEIQALDIDSHLLSKDIDDFAAMFVRARLQYAQQKRQKISYLFDVLLAAVMLPWFPDQKDVFGPPEQLSNYRLFETGNLIESDAELLRGVLQNVSNSALKARLGDILWVFKRDHVSARVAVSSYVEYAKETDSAQEWIQPVFALTRALSVAKKLGKNNPQIEDILGYIKNCVVRESGKDSLFYSNRLIQLLLNNDYGDTEQLAAFAESLARSEEQSSEFSPDRSEQHWHLAATCYRKLGDGVNERRTIIESAETWVKAAEQGLQQPNLARFLIAGQYERAIHILRSISETQERVEELHRRLLAVQREAVKQMVPSSSSLEDHPEVPKLRKLAIEAVKKETFLEAFLAFSQLQPSPSIEAMRRQAQEMQDRYILKKLFPIKIVDAFGRTVANPPQSEKEMLLADVFQHQNLLRPGVVSLSIEPARQEILHSYTFDLQDLMLIVSGNPLIPYGHEYSVLKGIMAGLQGDFFVSSHLLVPQIEATCRHVLRMKEKLTSKYTSERVQDERSLNQMFEEEYSLVLSEVLGEDTVYNLRGLLVDRFGANLRNNLSHGLLFDEQLAGPDSIYFWYISVNVYCRPLIAAIQSHSDETRTGGEA